MTFPSFYFSLVFLLLSVVHALPVCYVVSLSVVELELLRRISIDAQLVIEHAAT